MTRRRTIRWIGIGVIALVAVVIVLRIGIGIYLHSAAGRQVVAGRLESMIGMPVEVSAINVGSRNSSLTFRVLDPKLDRSSPNASVLTVESATADVSLTQVITGRANPKELRLDGLELALRLDSSGNLLTTLPSASSESASGEMPTIRVERGRLRILQEGRPEFALAGMSLTAEPRGDAIALSGGVDDPNWGKWTVAGELNKNSKTGWLQVASDDVPVAAERLRSIPYVPASVWENVQLAGRLQASARIAIGTGNDLKYDARLEANGVTLAIPPAEIALTESRGVVHIHDGLIEVSGVKDEPTATAKLAGGTVSASAKWAFDKDPAIGDPIAVSVRNLAVNKLPEKWGLKTLGGQLPGKLSLENGLLTGDAKLRLVAHADGKLETYGGGSGAIHVAAFDGGSLDIAVKLGGDGKKLEFSHAAAPPKPAPKAAAIPPEILLLLIALQPKEEAKSDQTNLDATITLRDIDIAKFIEQLELKIPYKIAGKVTVQAKFGVPLGEVATRASYRLTGTLTSPELRFEGLIVRNVVTEISYQNGKLTLTKLKGSIPQPGDAKATPGEFSGNAFAAIDPPGKVTANLTLTRIPLASVAAAIPGSTLTASGLVSGQANFEAPFKEIEDTTTWDASASLRSDAFTVADRTVKDLTISLNLAKGIATLKEGSLIVESIPITASGSLALKDKYKFDAELKTTGTSIADFRKLIPEAVEGSLDIDAKAEGTLSPFSFTSSGSVTASKLTLAKTPANHIEVKWDLTKERVRITSLSAKVFGGSINGSADYPFSPDKSGDFTLEFKEVDAGAAAAFVPDSPVKITGAISGKIAGKIPASRDGVSRIGDIDIDLTAPKLTVQNIPAERLVGKAAVKNGAIDYSLEGKTLGGSFEVKGRYPGMRKQSEPKQKGRGSLKLHGLDLARLAGALRSQSLKALAGTVDVTFDFENDFSSGSGRVLIHGLKWGKEVASPEMVGVLLLRDGFLELRELDGSIAGGLLRGRGRMNIANPARNFVTLALDRANARKLLAPFPDLADLVDGEISLAVHGSFGREVRGSGFISLPRGTVGGAELSELRIPFDFAGSPGGSGHLSIREATSRSAAGRVSGNLTLDWGTALRITGQLRFIDVPLRGLSPALGENSMLGNGRITGRLDLAGAEVRSINDLTGTLAATLSNASPKEIPLIQQTLPYLNTLGLAKPFQSGDIRGTISGGVFRIQRLALSNPGAQLFADGSITMQNGRLDLGVVAHTGPVGPQAAGFRLLVSKLPLFGPIPISLIRDVNDLLTNRTIRLSITGTAANPVVRVNAGALLTEEAVRFFLTRYILPADAAEAIGYGSMGGVSR